MFSLISSHAALSLSKAQSHLASVGHGCRGLIKWTTLHHNPTQHTFTAARALSNEQHKGAKDGYTSLVTLVLSGPRLALANSTTQYNSSLHNMHLQYAHTETHIHTRMHANTLHTHTWETKQCATCIQVVHVRVLWRYGVMHCTKTGHNLLPIGNKVRIQCRSDSFPKLSQSLCQTFHTRLCEVTIGISFIL